MDRRARADATAGLHPRTRPGFLRPRTRPAHRAASAPAPGLPRRRAPPPPHPPAHHPALGRAAPGRRRAHERPDRPPPGHIRGNRAYPPGKHLPPAAGLQPDRRRHTRVRRPDDLTPPDPGPGRRARLRAPLMRLSPAAHGRPEDAVGVAFDHAPSATERNRRDPADYSVRGPQPRGLTVKARNCSAVFRDSPVGPAGTWTELTTEDALHRADSAWLTAVSAMGSASRRSNPICAAPACRPNGPFHYRTAGVCAFSMLR